MLVVLVAVAVAVLGVVSYFFFFLCHCVAGKADYSNQLMVFCDEWELDPQLLKFSTPLGQGAFGKVVTGYYSDHKVAIKLVKGNYEENTFTSGCTSAEIELVWLVNTVIWNCRFCQQ